MKKIILVGLLMSVFFNSCISIYHPYLKEDKSSIVRVNERDSVKNFYITMFACKKESCMFDHFFFDISITVFDRQYSTFILHSLILENDKGDTIPYTLSYYPERPFSNRLDSLNVTLHNDTMMAIFGHKDNPYPKFYVSATSEVPAFRIRKIHVVYDMEINGERISGDCWFRKRIVIDSRMRFPGHVWYLY